MKIILDKRDEVIEQIELACARGDLNARVEVDDPHLTRAQEQEQLEKFCEQYGTTPFLLKTCLARIMVNVASASATRDTVIEGAKNVAGLKGGAIITSNHFSPADNAVVRKFARTSLHQPYLPIVSNTTNLAMEGLFGFLMNYADIIPVNSNPHYLRDHFEPQLMERLRAGKKVLIYPEQEMWFNYRKPRPCKRGAYLYAAKANVPVISCFVELRESEPLRQTDFVHVSYVMHVLDPIYPDPALSAHENSKRMCERDYQQKVAAYERAYGRALTYDFEPSDVAGWVPPAQAAAPAASSERTAQPAFWEALAEEL